MAASRLLGFHPAQPGLASTSPSRLLFASALHLAALSCEILLILFLLTSLWCLEPTTSPSTPATSSGGGSSGREILVVGECSFSSLLLYLILPPLASILPPFLSLVAISAQSPRMLRTVSQWRTVSLLPTLLTLALAPKYAQQLGTSVLVMPVFLTALCAVQVQLGVVEVAELEAARPVRGWRGLIEVREVELVGEAVLAGHLSVVGAKREPGASFAPYKGGKKNRGSSIFRST